MMYRNREDFSDKEDWQSRMAMGRARAVVKQAAANLTKILMSADQWVYAKGWGMESLLEEFVGSSISHLIKSREFGFIDAFETAIESALACDIGILKVVPTIQSIDAADLSGQQRGSYVTLQATAINFRKFHYGPYSTSKKWDWCAEDSVIPYSYLEATGRYNEEAMRKVKYSNYQEPAGTEDEWFKFDFATPWMRPQLRSKTTQVREFYGDVFDDKGNIAGRNMKITILNGQELGKIEKNPTPWPPYTAFSPLNVAFRLPGEGSPERTA